MKNLAEAIRAASPAGRLPCRRAFDLAASLGIEPFVLGREVTAIGVKISHCELGLFGHTETGKGRIVNPDPEASLDLKREIAARLTGGRLPCRSAWEIAAEKGLSRLAVSCAAEGLGVHISSCQLGCFP